MSTKKPSSASSVSVSEEAKAAYYLTFKMDLIKTELISRADAIYRPSCGLDVRSVRVLRLICEMPGITSSRLRSMTLIEKSTLSKLLAAMLERDLVRRTINAEDSRYFNLWPTEAGHRLRAETDKLASAMEVEILWMLSTAEIAQLNHLVGKVMDSLFASAGPEAG